MSTATMRSGGTGRGRDEARESTVWVWLALVAALALIALLVAWFAGWFRPAPDPRVTEILAMQREAREQFATNGGPRTLAEATAAVAAMNAINEKVDALPEPLRQQVDRAGGSVMRDMFRGRIDAYLAAPPAQRRAELDRQIDQEEFMRKAFEAGRTVANAVGGSPAAAPAGGQSAPAAGAGGGPPRGTSQDDRNRWRKNMIDRTTPEERARYTEYRRAMEKRREERGLSSGGPR